MELSMKKLSEIDIAVPGIGQEQYAWLKKFLISGGGGILFSEL